MIKKSAQADPFTSPSKTIKNIKGIFIRGHYNPILEANLGTAA